MDKQFVPSCPKCNSEWAHIIDEGNRKICVCTKCLYTEIFYNSYVEPELFHSILTDLKNSNMPKIITSSYETLISLIEDNEIYGALIKIKDIFELVIKLPLIIILSHISNKVYPDTNKISDFEKDFSGLHSLLQEFIYDAVSYQLTLGNWESISGLIKKHKINDLFPNTNISSFLYVLWTINQKNHKAYTSLNDGTIASWRNKTIGHGALNCNKLDVKKDIFEKLELLNSLLKSTMEDYDKINILIEEKLISVKAKQDSTIISVEPFITLVNHQNENNTKTQYLNTLENLSVFESYNEKKQLGHIINYSDGKKHISNNLTTMLTFIDNNLKRFSTLSLINSKHMGNLEDDTIYSTEIEILNSLNETTFHNGNYFSDWFIHCIDTYTGGVFLCCAERGMGKSAFSRVIDQTETIKIKDNNALHKYLYNNSNELLIRTFHFNSYYNSNIFTFIAKIKDIFTTILVTKDDNTKHLESIIYISNNIEEIYTSLYNSINDVSISVTQKKNLFLKFLKSLFSLWKYRYQKQKLILVLDGLDEIKDGDNNINLANFLPDNNDLKSNDLDGIYIILTSRCLDEINSNYKLSNFLTSYNFTNTLILKRELNQTSFQSPYSQAFITEIKKIFSLNDNSQAISIANSLEWRYNYLTAYKKLYSVNLSKNLQDFINDPFEVYLSQLSTFSKSYAEDIKSMLNLLSMTNESLTISEISYLITGDNKPTFKLYGMLMDIINFLNVERGYQRGTLFNISHPDWIEKINKNQSLATNRKTLTDKLAKQLLEISTNTFTVNDFSSPIYDGESWLISNMHLFITSKSEYIDLFTNIDFGQDLYQTHRCICSNNHILDILKKTDITTLGNSWAKKYINTFLSLAVCYATLNDYSKSLSNCDAAINICNKLTDSNKYAESFVLKSLSNAYHKKAQILKSFSEFNTSEKYYLMAIKLKEKLAEDYKNGGEFFDLDSLASSYNNLAILLKKSDPTSANIFYAKAIDIKEKLAEDYKNGGEYYDLNSLARSYNNLANLLKNSDPSTAEKLHNKAIDIREKLAEDYKNGGEFFDLDSLASSYNNLASLLKNLQPQRAHELYLKAIEIRELLITEYKHGGYFFDINLLAKSYINTAKFLADYNSKESLELFTKAIEIREKLAEEYINGGRFFDLNQLAYAYNTFAILLTKADWSKSITLYETAIDVLSQLNPNRTNTKKLFDLSKLTDSLITSAKSTETQTLSKSIDLFNKTIKIKELLAADFKNGGRFFDMDSLATSYNGLALILKDVEPDCAEDLHSKAIEIREQLALEYKNGGRFFDLNTLARSYYNLANLLKNHKFNKAYELYSKAIEIREQLALEYKNGGRFFDLDLLAKTYVSLSKLLKEKNLDKSLSLCNQAIRIREQLALEYKNGGRFFDLDSLTKTYKQKNILLNITNNKNN